MGAVSSKISYSHLVRQVYIERAAEDYASAALARKYLPALEFRVVDDQSEIPEEHLKGTTLFLRRHRGEQVGRCPGSHGHLCCNYHTVDLYAGCGLGCTYCIMQSYLNFSPVSVYVDPAPAIEAIRALASRDSSNDLRIGTGEIGDSLLYDPIFGLSEQFILGVSDLDNVHFELKTKTDFVDHLLDIDKKGNAIIGFSLNPEEIGTREEGMSSPVGSRIAAARRAVDAGYRTSFHFDPVFNLPGWRELYYPLIDSLRGFPPGSVAWISLGTFRYTPGLKDRIADRKYLYDEYVPSVDGKYRYLQKVRSQMYRELIEKLGTITDAGVYLCMESEAVWKRVYGALPNEIPNLESIFDDDPARLNS
jgi:spore photoproduct lyase